jgi:hypothetical protein
LQTLLLEGAEAAARKTSAAATHSPLDVLFGSVRLQNLKL